ncbi:MAG: DNA polymerase III subunit alpha [Bacilli bacterium]|nr:DNA polymerase III subunit alpha [Bacilli bacterium]
MVYNLILRTEYSFLNSLCSLKKIVETAKKYHYDALTITDFGNLHAGYKFYKECVKNNIKPVIGIEIIVKYNEQTENLILYAMDDFGYKNILKIASKSKLSNNLVDINYLEQNQLGLIALLPPNNKQIEMGSTTFLKMLTNIFQYVFVGIDNKLVSHPSYKKIHQWLSSLNINEVAVQPTHYINQKESEALDVLKAIKLNKTLKELDKNTEDYHFFTQEEFYNNFGQYEYLLDNTKRIIDLCNVSINTGGFILPEYDGNIDQTAYLKALCYKGLQKRINNITDVYWKRLEKELQIINKMGFESYFLIVWDYVKYAKKNNILVGPGRGSAPASLVSYSLGITDIDPIQYNLLFERFLNPERISMPDIDIDFPDNKRDEVIRYVGAKYGKMRVAHIVTFGTFASRSAIREVSKTLELSSLRLEELLKLVDSQSNLQTLVNESEPLKKLMNSYEDIKKVVEIALAINGLPRNTSTHAAGIIITKHDLINYTPLDLGLNDIYLTQYEASDLEELGLLKMDFLGLRNLTIIKNCIDMIQKDVPNFQLPKVYNDKQTLALIAKADTTGVFQLESEGMKQTLRQMKVSSFEDICSSLALYRPGPMDMINTFVDRKLGKTKVEYLHPDLEAILRPTYGIIVYQEQIILIACKFAGYSLGEADILRRAVSKKKLDILEKERIKFVNSSIKNGYSKDVAEQIYEYIIKFANYGFNRAHSVAYSVISYQTAFLKCYYPTYYYSVLINSVIGTNLLAGYLTEISRRHLKVLTPDINLSTDTFKVMNNSILMPLTQIEGIGPSYYEEFIEVRKNGLFKSFDDFITRCSTVFPSSLIENLIYAGALDSFNITKKDMIDNYGLISSRNKYAFVKNTTDLEFSGEEFSYGYLLTKEHDVLSVNINYNFLYQYEGYYKRRIARHISELKEGAATILGVVTRIKEITTKKDAKMFFATIKDETGTISVTVFPTRYLSFKEVKTGMVLLISGNVEMRNNELQLVLNEFKQI